MVSQAVPVCLKNCEPQRKLEHHGGQYSSASASQGSEMNWDLRNRNNQVVASGVYFYHVEAGDARRVGRFTVVNFAQ